MRRSSQVLQSLLKGGQKQLLAKLSLNKVCTATEKKHPLEVEFNRDSCAEPPPACPRVEKGEVSFEEVFKLADVFSRVKGR